MRPKTTMAAALAGAVFAVPAAAALAAQADDPPSPLRTALRAPVGGHLTVKAQMLAEARQNRQDVLERRAVRLAERVAGARDERFDAGAERAEVANQAPARLHERMRELRDDLREARRPEPVAPAASPVLEAIAACESGGDPAAIGGGGLYRGKYQFSLSTWASVGGAGDPASASEAEQDKRAAILYAREGASPWPVCGR